MRSMRVCLHSSLDSPCELCVVGLGAVVARGAADLYVTRLVGASETAWRRYCERKAVSPPITPLTTPTVSILFTNLGSFFSEDCCPWPT